MSQIDDDPKEDRKDRIGQCFGVEIDELGLKGLSALLSFPPCMSVAPETERRSGQDRRAADRRVTAREFTVQDA